MDAKIAFEIPQVEHDSKTFFRNDGGSKFLVRHRVKTDPCSDQQKDRHFVLTVRTVCFLDRTYRLTADLRSDADRCKRTVDQPAGRCALLRFGRLKSTPGSVWTFSIGLESLEESMLSRLSESWRRVLGTGEHSDVVLASNGVRIKAHRAVLAARSAVFCRMFQTDMRELQEGVVNIDDVSPSALRELVSFMYTAAKPDLRRMDLAMQVFLAADKYDVQDLKVLCADRLKELSPDNVLDTIALAKSNDHPDLRLKQSCMEFIAENFVFFRQSLQWSMFARDNEDLAKEIEDKMSNTTAGTKNIRDVGWTLEGEISYEILQTKHQSKVVFWSSEDTKIMIDYDLHEEPRSASTFHSGHSYGLKMAVNIFSEDLFRVTIEMSSGQRSWRKTESFVKYDVWFYLPNLVPWSSSPWRISILLERSVQRQKRPSPLQNLSESWKRILESGDLADVELTSGDVGISAHKTVLAARSPAFSKMVLADPEKDVITVHVVSPPVLKELVRFLYTGTTDLGHRSHEQDLAKEVIQAADKYDLQDLKDLIPQGPGQAQSQGKPKITDQPGFCDGSRPGRRQVRRPGLQRASI